MSGIRSVARGSGSYLPERVLSNDDLARRIDTSDDWIVQRTGIRQRYIAAEGEFTSHPVSYTHLTLPTNREV